jgi:hypothetical protein
MSEGVRPSAEWQVRVRGVLDAATAQRFGRFRVVHEHGLTVLEGPSGDGHGLASLLMDLQALGLEVVDIRRRGA